MSNKRDELNFGMDPRAVVARNSPLSCEYSEESFTAVLHEQGIWHRDQYWLLEWALYDLLSRENNTKDLHGSIFHIFSFAMNAIASHFDENDFFKIKNLDREEIYDFRDRIKIVFEGFFFNRLVEQVIFEEINPLLLSRKSEREGE